MKIIKLMESNIDPNVDEYIENEASSEEQELIQDLEDILDIETEIENPSLVTDALDNSLEVAIEAYNIGKVAGKAANVLFVGRAGTGKTAQVVQWARTRKVNLVQADAKTLDPTDIGGIVARAVDEKGTQLNKATKLSNSQFDTLATNGSVLFLDELNRASSEVMGSLLTLILDHVVEDASWTEEDVAKYGGKVGMRPFNGFLFTVACINPTSGAYEGVNELDMAMRGRFAIYEMGDTPDTAQYLKYITGSLEKELKQQEEAYERKPSKFKQKTILKYAGRIAIAKKLLTSPMWRWDTPEEEMEASMDKDSHQTLSPRDFSALIRACDGTKEDVINKWPRFCNENKLDMVEEILSDYEDIDDKANSVFSMYKDGELVGDGEDNGIFGASSMWDALEGLI